MDSSIIRLRPTHPNHGRAICCPAGDVSIDERDFVHDKLSVGRSSKMLTVLNDFTRPALAVTVRTRMGVEDVLEALCPLLLSQGTTEYIRPENGPEFAAEAMQAWLHEVGIKPICIYPGSPCENGHNERFIGTLHIVVLSAEWFITIEQA